MFVQVEYFISIYPFCVGHLSAPRSKYMGLFQALLLLQIMVSQVHYLLNPSQQTLYIGY